MKKIISSIFILLLLLLVIWGGCAWYLGTKAADSLNMFLSRSEKINDDLFEYDLLAYDASIFGAKAKISVSLNDKNNILTGVYTAFDAVVIDVSIHNGPLLIDKSGVTLGSSIWLVTLDPERNNELFEQLSYEKLPLDLLAKFTVNFDKGIEYQLPLLLSFADVLIEGVYNAQQLSNITKATALNWSTHYKNKKVDAKKIELKFTHIKKSDTDSDVVFRADIPQFNFKHDWLSEALSLHIVSDANLSLNSGVLNANADMYVKNSEDSIYPIDRSDLRFQLKSLSLQSIVGLLNNKAEINSLKRQIQWVLEEQGELPEGQAKLWRLQDKLNKYQQDLVSSVLAVVGARERKDSIVTFFVKSYINDKHSYLNGSFNMMPEFLVKSQTSTRAFPNEQPMNRYTFSNMTQFNSDVSLDDSLYQFLSSNLPIKSNKFKLIYKDNKLLMQ